MNQANDLRIGIDWIDEIRSDADHLLCSASLSVAHSRCSVALTTRPYIETEQKMIGVKFEITR